MKLNEMKNCPCCKALWRDEEGFGVNIMGIEIRGKYDGVSYWKCTSCNTYWDRFTERVVEEKEVYPDV